VKLKKLCVSIGAQLLAIAIKLAPIQFLHAIKQIEPLPPQELPQNPLRDAVDNRVYPFGH
jgi:hypothetical protein